MTARSFLASCTVYRCSTLAYEMTVPLCRFAPNLLVTAHPTSVCLVEMFVGV